MNPKVDWMVFGCYNNSNIDRIVIYNFLLINRKFLEYN